MVKKRLFNCRIAAIFLLVATAIILEKLEPFESFRFFTLIVIFLLSVDLASLLRRKVRDALVVLASVVFGFCVVEGIAIVREPKIATISSKGLYASKPVVGWGASHAGLYHEERTDLSTGKAIFKADYTIDEHLWRQTQSTEFGPAVVFFGDSFTFGNGLNDNDTLPQQFSDVVDHRIKVFNSAFGGYGPAQFLRALQENMLDSTLDLKPNLFVFLTAAWHAERTACRADWTRPAPRFVLENGLLLFRGTCREAQNVQLRDWLHHLASYRLYVEPLILRPNDGDVELYIRTLLAAVHLGEERYGVRTIVPYLRAEGYLQASTRFTDDVVMARLREGGAIVLDVSLTQEQAEGAALSIPGDGHPTALANRLRAGMLKEYLERDMAGTLLSELR